MSVLTDPNTNGSFLPLLADLLAGTVPTKSRMDRCRPYQNIRLICLFILFIIKGLLNSSGDIEIFYILGYMGYVNGGEERIAMIPWRHWA